MAEVLDVEGLTFESVHVLTEIYEGFSVHLVELYLSFMKRISSVLNLSF
jgi:hypothetical protein